jgi:5-deoxy-glucuronate isomerase
MTSRLLVRPDTSANAPRVHEITPANAGWRYVGFEVLDLAPGQALARELPDREQCLVLLSGRAGVRVAGKDFGTLGARASPFGGKPFAVYVPPKGRGGGHGRDRV